MPQIEGGPKGLNSILESAYSAAIGSGHDKGTASAIAWSAAKNKYKQNKNGNWVAKLYRDLRDVALIMQSELLKSPDAHNAASKMEHLVFALSKLAEFTTDPEGAVADEAIKKSAIEHLAVSSVEENPLNREIDRSKVEGIKRNIEQTGSVKPLVYVEIDKDGQKSRMITDGHHRLVALMELGYDTFPARVSDDRGVDTTKDDLPVRLRKEVASADVDGLGFVRQDLQGKPKKKKPLDVVVKFEKGGPGSGSWEGPGQPRFPHAGNRDFAEPFHSGNHVKQFLVSNNLVIGSVDRSDLSPEKNAMRQQEFERYLQDKKIPYKKGMGQSKEWGSEVSYIINTPTVEDSNGIEDQLYNKYKQDAVIRVRNAHAVVQPRSAESGVRHVNVNNGLEAGDHLDDDYTLVDGQKFKLNFK